MFNTPLYVIFKLVLRKGVNAWISQQQKCQWQNKIRIVYLTHAQAYLWCTANLSQICVPPVFCYSKLCSGHFLVWCSFLQYVGRGGCRYRACGITAQRKTQNSSFCFSQCSRFGQGWGFTQCSHPSSLLSKPALWNKPQVLAVECL